MVESPWGCEIKGGGGGPVRGKFQQTRVHLCVSLSFSGAACQPGNGGMWIVCHLCQEPWLPCSVRADATRGNRWKALEGEE